MNAAARLVHQHALTRHLLVTQILTWKQTLSICLLFFVLGSAVGTIYITHSSRLLHANYQRNLVEKNRLQIEHSQLLLERSALMMQTRVSHNAHENLDLVVPDTKSLVIVRE